MGMWTVQLKDTLGVQTVEADSFFLDEGAWRFLVDKQGMVAAFNAEQVVSIMRREPVSEELRAALKWGREGG